jgi:hypothetical protein
MKRYRIFALLAAVLTALVAACATESIEGERIENQPPRVWLSAAPPEGSTEKYRVQLFWGGWDPDGELLRYEFLVTDNVTGVFDPADTAGATWSPVIGNDSTFTFSADELIEPDPDEQVAEFARSHTFFIRAVDAEGARSVRPAYRSFTARTLSPQVNILVPVSVFGSADVPPITTFRWRASDYVSDRLTSQEPDSVQWAMVSTVPFGNNLNATLEYLRTDPASAKEWFPWTYYRAENDSGKTWTTPPMEFGTYIFAIRAKDEAGAVTPVLDDETNVRRVRVSTRITGPLLTVNNIYMGAVQTTSCRTPLTILDVPAGIQLQFNLSASAESYGGLVAGYRYGWDIADLEDPSQWEVDYTPFVSAIAATAPRTYFFGTHTLTVDVIDNSGFCSRIEVKVNVIQFTLERNVLIIDDFSADNDPLALPGFTHPTGRGILPSDAEHDAFWLDMVSNLAGFDPASDVLQTSNTGEVPLALLARYKSVMWSVYSDIQQRSNYPLLYSYIQYRQVRASGGGGSGKVQPNYLALAMAAGGHIMISGSHPIQLVENRQFAGSVRHPLIFLYELEGLQTGSGPNVTNPIGDKSFAYKELCLEVIDYAFMTVNRRRYRQPAPTFYCPVNLYRRADNNSLRDDTMRGVRTLDPNFPPATLRAEITAFGKAYQPSEKGLDAEVYNPAYFRSGRACQYVPRSPRSCFQPIYGVDCLDVAEPTYNQPVAFWTSAFADRVAEVPGAVGARSVVFGFAPVYLDPVQIKPAFEYILYEEWKLPRKTTIGASASR